MFQSIVSGTYPVEALTLISALLAIGIEVQAGGDGCVQLTGIDLHEKKGFKLTRLAITDRWGMYREFDEEGCQLHARACRMMRTKDGCSRALRFQDCGCACPYLHARSSELGRWLVASARKEARREPAPWHRLLAHKDSRGYLLLRGLPYVDGLCMTSTEWRALHPDHKPSRKHQLLTQEETMATVDAFDPLTVAKVTQTRAEIETAWKRMQEYW